jgi:hypothetical protein
MLGTLQKISPANEAKMDDTGRQSAGNNFSWLAAMVNGEGSIGLNKIWSTPPKRQRRRFFSPRIAVVSNTDPAIVVRCIEIVESLGIRSHYIQEKDDGKHKPLFTLRVDRMEDIKTILIAILPYMVGEKKARGQLLLNYVESRISRINTPNPKWENVRPSQRHKKSNPPYNDRELGIAETLGNWNPNDHTLPAEVLRRYDLDSDRKTESTAEMTVPAA